MKINKKYTTASITALGLLALIGASSAYADNSNYQKRGNGNFSPEERQERMIERLERAVENGRITQSQADERLARMAVRKAARDAMHSAIENNNYAAWALAAGDRPITEKITANNFHLLVQAHSLREAGDREGARAIMKELGVERGHGKFKHQRPNR